MKPVTDWEYYAEPENHVGQMGSAHAVSADGPDYDAAEEVRKIAEEVTGKPIPRVTRRIGFV